MKTLNHFKSLCLGLACCVPVLASAAPFLPGQLQLRSVLTIGEDAGVTPNSTFNPRSVGAKNYGNQINVMAYGRYASGSNVPEVSINNFIDPFIEHRTVLPFPGANSST